MLMSGISVRRGAVSGPTARSGCSILNVLPSEMKKCRSTDSTEGKCDGWSVMRLDVKDAKASDDAMSSTSMELASSSSTEALEVSRMWP